MSPGDVFQMWQVVALIIVVSLVVDLLCTPRPSGKTSPPVIEALEAMENAERAA